MRELETSENRKILQSDWENRDLTLFRDKNGGKHEKNAEYSPACRVQRQQQPVTTWAPLAAIIHLCHIQRTTIEGQDGGKVSRMHNFAIRRFIKAQEVPKGRAVSVVGLLLLHYLHILESYGQQNTKWDSTLSRGMKKQTNISGGNHLGCKYSGMWTPGR